MLNKKYQHHDTRIGAERIITVAKLVMRTVNGLPEQHEASLKVLNFGEPKRD